MEEVTIYNDEIEVQKRELKIELEINEIKKKNKKTKKDKLNDENNKLPINKKI